MSVCRRCRMATLEKVEKEVILVKGDPAGLDKSLKDLGFSLIQIPLDLAGKHTAWALTTENGTQPLLMESQDAARFTDLFYSYIRGMESKEQLLAFLQEK